MAKWKIWVSYLYRAGLMSYLPCLFILPLYVEDTGWWQSSYLFRVLEGFFATLPIFALYVEAGYVATQWSGRKNSSLGKRVVDIITSVATAIAFGLYLLSWSGVLQTLAFIYYLFIYCLFILCVLWIPIAWILRVTIWRKTLYPRVDLGHKKIQILALILCLIFLAGGVCSWHIRDLGFRWNQTYGWYHVNEDL